MNDLLFGNGIYPHKIYFGNTLVTAIYKGSERVWPRFAPTSHIIWNGGTGSGTADCNLLGEYTFDVTYSGTVQSVTAYIYTSANVLVASESASIDGGTLSTPIGNNYNIYFQVNLEAVAITSSVTFTFCTGTGSASLDSSGAWTLNFTLTTYYVGAVYLTIYDANNNIIDSGTLTEFATTTYTGSGTTSLNLSGADHAVFNVQAYV